MQRQNQQHQPDFSVDTLDVWSSSDTGTHPRMSHPASSHYQQHRRFQQPNGRGFPPFPRTTRPRGQFQHNGRAMSSSRGYGHGYYNPKFSNITGEVKRGKHPNSYTSRYQPRHQHQQKFVHQQSENVGNPWLTPEIQKMIQEKDEMWKVYSQERTEEGYRNFKIKRIQVNMAVNDAKLIYYQKNPNSQQIVHHASVRRPEFYCDPCEKKFVDQETLEAHKAEHITCKLDGCKYNAHVKLVMKHIELQHSTDLFNRIKGYDTPEEIKKWIQERKMNFPTPENIARKKAELLERRDRGETLSTKTPSNNPEIFRHKIVPEKRDRSNFHQSGPAYQSDGDEEFRPKRPRKDGEREYFHEKPQFSSLNQSHIIKLLNFYTDIKINDQGQLVGFTRETWQSQDVDKIDNQIKNFEKGDEEKETLEFIITDDEDDIFLRASTSQATATVPFETKEVLSSCNNIAPTVSFPLLCTSTGDNSIRNTNGCLGKSVGLLGLANYSSDSDVELDLEDGEVKSDSEVPCETSNLKLHSEAIVLTDSEHAINTPKPQQKTLVVTPKTTDTLDPPLSDGEAPDELPVTVSTLIENDDNHNLSINNHSCPVNTNQMNHTNRISNKGRDKDKPIWKNQKYEDCSRRIVKKYTLLQRLLAPDIRHERNIIMQVCRFVVDNNFFDPPTPTLKVEAEGKSPTENKELKETVTTKAEQAPTSKNTE